MTTTTISIDYLIELTKAQERVKELERKAIELELLVQHLQKRVDEARPHMEAIRRAQTTDKTLVIDYDYTIK
jgi:predicted  nucleic acid-binding Zn-ribbon protein